MKKSGLLIVMLVTWLVSLSQQDTTELIKEFSKVMSFTTQPYLYYKSVTKMDSNPLLNPKDSMTSIGFYYKNNSNFTCISSREEMYLEDGILVQINNDRKTIWISKVNVENSKNINAMPAALKQMQKLIQKNYTVSKSKVTDEVSVLRFETKKVEHSTSSTTAVIQMNYSEKSYLPTQMVVEMKLKQPVDNEMIEAIKNEGIDESKLIQTNNGVKYIATMQRISVDFIDIDSRKEKVEKMPSYTEKVVFNEKTQQYRGQGEYLEYEVTKTY